MGDIIKKSRDGQFIGWYIRFIDVDGRRKQRASHQPSKADARRYLVEVEARVARGLIGIPEPQPAPEQFTVAELCERFLREFSSPRIKDLDRYRKAARYSLRPVLEASGKLGVEQLTLSRLEQLRNSLSRRLRPNTVRAALAPLSAVLTWAVKQHLLASHPMRGLELPRREQSLEYLSHDEVRRVLYEAERRARSGSESDFSLYVAISLALYCGLRRGEVFGLRWIDISLDARRLTVARSYDRTPKSGKARHIPISSELVPLLTEWRSRCPATQERLICPVRFNGRWHMAKKAAGGLLPVLAAAGVPRPSAPWHALRHTFASHFIMSGGNILTLQRLLGHADVQTTQIYAHLAPDFMAGEVERLKFR